MPRPCSVCLHPDRDQIDHALVDGKTALEVAGNAGLSRSAVDRHGRDHIRETVARASQIAEIARGDGILAHAVGLTERAARLLDAAEEAGDRKTALAAVRETRECLRFLDALRPQPDSEREQLVAILGRVLEPADRVRVADALEMAGL